MSDFVPFEPEKGMEGNFIPYEAVEEGLIVPPVPLICARCRDVITTAFEKINGEFFHIFCAKQEQFPLIMPPPIRKIAGVKSIVSK